MENTMTEVEDALPDTTRPDAGIALISQWTVHDRERQVAAAEAAIAGWKHVPWPRGLLSHTCFARSDGKTLLHYSQWEDDRAIAAFVGSDRPAWMRFVDEAAPGVQRDWAYASRLYRSMEPSNVLRQPGCIVVVSFETGGVEAQRNFVDALIDRVEQMAGVHHPGAISSRFHLSSDGTRIFNYSEWTTAEAHAEMLQTRLTADSTLLRFIEGMPGVRPLGFERFVMLRSLARSPSTNALLQEAPDTPGR
jgi:hypothetical protein